MVKKPKKKPAPKAEVATAPDLLPPTNDVVFKHVFGNEKNKDATAKLLSAILNADIKEADISFDDPHLKREFPKDKMGVLDISVRLKNGKTVAVEMLTGKFSNILRRLEYYISKMTVSQLGKGSTYPEIQPVVFILIATKPVLKNTAKYHSEFVMMEKNEHYALHDLRALHIIELSKLPPRSRGRLEVWMKFLLTDKKEDMMALVKKHPELKSAGDGVFSASQVRALNAWYNRDLSQDRDVLDQIDYAVTEAMKKAERNARRRINRAVAAERRKAEEAMKKAEDAQKKVTEMLKLVKKGYAADKIEKMLQKQ